MKNLRMHLQIYILVVLGLLSFAMIAGLLWLFLGHAEANRLLLQRSSGLTSLLLPDATASQRSHQEAVEHAADVLDLSISVYTPNHELLASSGPSLSLEHAQPEPGQWSSSHGGRRWTTRLSDDRHVVLEVPGALAPDPILSTLIFFVAVALLIALGTYPFIRQVTGRLERLQESVERMGEGELSARAEVSGQDEIASLAQSFNETAEKLEQLIASQKLLLAHASHEFRTPVARIQLGLELLESDDRPERRSALRQDVRELGTLIEELLLLVRLETNTEPDTALPLELLSIVAEETARYRGCEVSGQPCMIEGRERMLRRLVRNLVENALLHGREPVLVSVTRHERWVTLEVADHGDGIPEGSRATLFEPFFRAPDRQNVEGFGLGLSIVQRIAHTHGAVVAYSDQDLSTFSVRFPASRNSTS